MSDVNTLLMNLALEAAEDEGLLEPAVTASELIAEDYLETQGQETLPDVLDHADKARDIADQLDELADRAEELADEDKTYAEKVVSVESMHREYCAIMRAHGLSEMSAKSFESAGNDQDRIAGIVQDCRRGAKLSRDFANSLMDLSEEGKILQFLRGNNLTLDQSVTVLKNSERALRKAEKEVKESPVVIEHKGIARFLTKDGKPVENLLKAVEHDVAWVKEAAAYAGKMEEALVSALKTISEGKMPSINLPDASKLATGKGGLMGAYTFNVDTSDKESGITVPQFEYVSEHKTDKLALAAGLGVGAGTVAVGVIAGGLSAGALLSGRIATGLMLKIGGRTASLSAAKAGFNTYDKLANRSDLKSQAGYSDLLKAMSDVESLGKIASSIHATDHEKYWDAAEKAVHDAESEEWKQLKKILIQLGGLESSMIHLIDAASTHATYLIRMVALTAEKVVDNQPK